MMGSFRSLESRVKSTEAMWLLFLAVYIKIDLILRGSETVLGTVSHVYERSLAVCILKSASDP